MHRTAVIAILAAGNLAALVAAPTSSRAGQYTKPTSVELSREGRATATALSVLTEVTPGTNGTYSQGAGIFPSGPFSSGCSFPLTPSLSVQIRKGKPKSVVNVSALASFGFLPSGGSKASMYAFSTINGVATPLPFAAQVDCLSILGELGTCTLTDVEWFDIDDLEANNPGQFKGKPLNIDLYVCIATDDTSILSIGEASLSVSMQKK